MKKGRNIVLCGFSNIEMNNHYLYDIRDCSNKDGINFPYLVYVENIKDALRHQGFLLIINTNKIENIKEFDLKYRKKLEKYNFIMILNKSYYGITKANKFSRIIKCNYDTFFYNGMMYYIENLYNDYSITNNRLSSLKKERLKKIFTLMKTLKEISTKELSIKLELSYRNIERYMHDLNNIYNCIGYDYSKNTWYFID